MNKEQILESFQKLEKEYELFCNDCANSDGCEYREYCEETDGCDTSEGCEAVKRNYC